MSPQPGQRAPVKLSPRATPQLAQDFASLITPSSIYLLSDKLSSIVTEENIQDRILITYPYASHRGNKILELLKKITVKSARLEKPSTRIKLAGFAVDKRRLQIQRRTLSAIVILCGKYDDEGDAVNSSKPGINRETWPIKEARLPRQEQAAG